MSAGGGSGRARRLGLVLVAAGVVTLVGAGSPARATPQRARTIHPARLPRQQRWDPLPVWAGGRRFVAHGFDGHVHTSHSRDARHPLADVIEVAERADLDALVITDHGTSEAARELREYDGELTVLLGEEVGGPFGHALAWNVGQRRGVQDATASMAELGALVHAQGGVVVLAHPGWWMDGRTWDPRRWMQPRSLARGGIAEHVDALELWNDVYHRPTRELLDEWARLLDAGSFVPVVGNSDFHSVGAHRLGTPRNMFLCPSGEGSVAPPRSLGSCLLDAVRSGRLYVTSGPTLSLVVGDRTLGETLAVRPGQTVHAAIEVQAPEGGTLDLFEGSRRSRSWPLPSGRVARFDVDVRAPDHDTGLHVEIRRPAPSRREPEISLVSNPVMLDVSPRARGWRGEDHGPLPAPEGFRRPWVPRSQRAPLPED